MDWKKKLSKPSKRTLVYSKKLDKFLPEEDIPVLEMAQEKRESVMKKLMDTDNTLTKEQAQGLAEEMLSKPDEAIKLLEETDDEPAKEEETSSEGS